MRTWREKIILSVELAVWRIWIDSNRIIDDKDMETRLLFKEEMRKCTKWKARVFLTGIWCRRSKMKKLSIRQSQTRAQDDKDDGGRRQGCKLHVHDSPDMQTRVTNTCIVPHSILPLRQLCWCLGATTKGLSRRSGHF